MDDLDSTKKRALKILGSRNFSESEMEKRLVSKGESQDNASEAVRGLVEKGYINDSEYANLIISHYSIKGYGMARIKDELFKRGIPKDMWDDKLAGLDDEEMGDAAYEYFCKKLRGSKDEDDIRRVSNALVRRGYSYEEVRNVMNRYMECGDM